MSSIRRTFVTFALLATLVPALGLAVMSFVSYREITQRNADHELRLVARGAAGELALQLRERAQALRTVSAAPLLVEAVSGSDRKAAAERAATYLRAVHGRLDGFVALALMDGAGAIVAASGDAEAVAGIDRAANVDGSAAASGSPPSGSARQEAAFVATRPRHDAADGRATLDLQVPVQDGSGQRIGALAGTVDLAPAVRRLGTTGGPAAEIVVATGDGLPIASPSSLLTRAPFAADTWVALRGDDGVPARYTDDAGRELLGVATRVGTIPLYVVAQRERAAVLRAWMDVARWFALLVAGLAILLGLVAWWMGRAIVTPLADLTAAADRVAAGDLTVTVRDDARDEVGRLARAFATMIAHLRAAQSSMTAMQRDLARKNVVLQKIATTDSITGLANRKAFDAVLAQRFEAFARSGTPFALVMVAMDNLDRVNADFGYPAGDELLVDLAGLLRQEMSGAATVARFAGERFMAILPDLPFDGAIDIAERIRTQVDAPGFGSPQRPITISAGVAQAREGDTTPESVLFRVDHALHEARREGGNRVRSAM